MVGCDNACSRWLPTVLARHHNRLVINVALGFDTYLVMRHGVDAGAQLCGHRAQHSSDAHAGAGAGAGAGVGDVVQGGGPVTSEGTGPDAARLGCYFCNDVVAPADSTRDRTLDQQCTVCDRGDMKCARGCLCVLVVCLRAHARLCRSRAQALPPSPLRLPWSCWSRCFTTLMYVVCGAMCEAACACRASNTHNWWLCWNTQGARAAASKAIDAATGVATMTAKTASPLGRVPHQLRGFVSHFGALQLSTAAYDKCTACSDHILRLYRTDGMAFVAQVLGRALLRHACLVWGHCCTHADGCMACRRCSIPTTWRPARAWTC